MNNTTTSKPQRPAPFRAARGSALANEFKPIGVCIVCGSDLLIQFWRGHQENQRVHCNDCGTEVTAWLHLRKQPNER